MPTAEEISITVMITVFRVSGCVTWNSAMTFWTFLSACTNIPLTKFVIFIPCMSSSLRICPTIRKSGTTVLSPAVQEIFCATLLLLLARSQAVSRTKWPSLYGKDNCSLKLRYYTSLRLRPNIICHVSLAWIWKLNSTALVCNTAS